MNLMCAFSHVFPPPPHRYRECPPPHEMGDFFLLSEAKRRRACPTVAYRVAAGFVLEGDR